MELRFESSKNEVSRMTTKELRSNFLVEDLIQIDKINLVYTMYDRMILGGVTPVHTAIALSNEEELKSKYFLERREIGIINTGGKGKIKADGQSYEMETLSCLYLGKGTQEVTFESIDVNNPATYFLLSTPAHQTYPNTLFTKEHALPVQLGSAENVNTRTIYKYIHGEGIQSCQLVMGLTVLSEGNIWNTMPAHTHTRRSEAYFYFQVKENNAVFHIMGDPSETRHLVIKNQEAIISPPWSVHSGAGTASYAFIWAMGGENQDFTDMDFIPINNLK